MAAEQTKTYYQLQNKLTLLSNSGKLEMRSHVSRIIDGLGDNPSPRELREASLMLKKSGLILGRKYRAGSGSLAEAAFREYAEGRVVDLSKRDAFQRRLEGQMLTEIEKLTKMLEDGEISHADLKNRLINIVGDRITNDARATTHSLIQNAGTGVRILQEPTSCEWCAQVAGWWEEQEYTSLKGFHGNCRCQLMPDLSRVIIKIDMTP